MNRTSFFFLSLSSLIGSSLSSLGSGVGGYSASNTFTVNSGNSTNPTYQIASASISGDPVYVGFVSSRDSSSVTFDTGTDENNATTYPFAGAGVFNPNAQIPNLTATLTAGAVSSISVSYPGGYDATGSGFTNAPEIVVAAPDGGGEAAIATATLSSGEITGISVTSGGSGYTAAPSVTVLGGPHFLRNTTEGSDYFGRYFLISSNTTTSLTLDTSRNNGDAITDVFQVGDTVEVVPAPTLGSLFGSDTSDLPTNWSVGFQDSSDWVYVWDHTLKGYFAYLHLGHAYEPGLPRGWYSSYSIADGIKNNKVIYPDEAFIVTKRTAGNVSFTFEGTVQTNDQTLFLPEGYNQVLVNNPYGTDLLLGELIPSTSIGTGASKFNPGTSASSANTDTVSFLQSDGSWKTFWYDSTSSSNPSVTASHVIGTRRPRESNAPATTMDQDDFYIGNGAISNLESCDSDGSNPTTANNDKNYTKITISNGTSDLQGFQITLASVQGYKLNDDGTKEANATTGLEVESPARGSVIYSNLIGTHEIVSSGSGYVVIEKQRDVTLKSDEQDAAASNATANWAIGSLGSGYSADASFYCVAGGATTNAKGTISTSGTITVSTAGAGYGDIPQVIVTGGGWRTSGSGSTPRGDYTVGSSEGVLIYRGYSTGTKTFLASSNPNN